MSVIPDSDRASVSAILEGVRFRDFTAPNIAYAAILAERKRCADIVANALNMSDALAMDEVDRVCAAINGDKP